MSALVLRWRKPRPRLVTRWRGPLGAVQVAPEARLQPLAAIIGPPGPAGPAGPPSDLEATVIDGGTFF